MYTMCTSYVGIKSQVKMKAIMAIMLSSLSGMARYAHTYRTCKIHCHYAYVVRVNQPLISNS